MADTKISGLPAAVVVNDTDELVLARGGTNLKAPASLVQAAALGTLQANLAAAQAQLTTLIADVDAIELEQGANPSGIYADVATRLAAIQGLTGTAPNFTVTGHTELLALTATAWTIANASSDRDFDADDYEFDELANNIATLAEDYTLLMRFAMTMAQYLITRGVFS